MGIHKTLSARPDEDPEFRAYSYRHPITTTMPTTARIEVCEYVNSFPSQYGDENGKLHCYRYVFDDDTEGTANHKAAPNWGPGDQVDYSITGDHRGTNKLKVSKVGGQQAQRGQPDRASAPPARAAAPARQSSAPARQGAPAGQGNGFLGVTVGMAVNNACHLALEEWKADESAQVDSTYWRRVWDHASQILRIAAVLEKGKLAPNPAKDGAAAEAENEPEPDPEPEPEAPPPRQPPRAASRPQPTRSGAAFDGPEDDDELPF